MAVSLRMKPLRMSLSAHHRDGPAGQDPADIGQLDATAAGKSTAWPKTSRPRSSKPARRGVPRHAGCHIAAHGQGHPGTNPPGIQPGGAQPHPPNDIGGGSACAGKKEVASLRTSCWGLKGRRKGLPPRAAIQAAPPRRRPASCRPNPCPPPASVGILPRRVPPLPARRPPARASVAVRSGSHPGKPARPASLFHSFIIAYYD